MITFNVKKVWFEKIKNGEKTHEYREVKDYWSKRLFLFSKISCSLTCVTLALHRECVFVCGYASKEDKEKRLNAKIKNISIVNGLETDLKIPKLVYDIEFELIKDGE